MCRAGHSTEKALAVALQRLGWGRSPQGKDHHLETIVLHPPFEVFAKSGSPFPFVREETETGVLSSLLEEMLIMLLFLFFFWGTSFIFWRAGPYAHRRAFNSLTSPWGLVTEER